MVHQTISLSDATRSTMTGLFNVLQSLSEFPGSYIMTIAAVASDEGKAVRDYAGICGCSLSMMSKRLLDLGDGASSDHTKPGAGLVEVRRDLMDRRSTIVKLSPTGRALAERLARMMGGAREVA